MLLFLNCFIIFCMFVIGSLFGSFFSLATYRLPRHQDIVATRSYCPKCKHRLEFLDLIPVISYIIRGGKCHYCGDKISLRYFLLESLNGLVFVIFYLVFGYTINCLIISLIYAILFVIVGSIIMSKKMTPDEKKEIKSLKEELKLNKKSGVFVSEIIVAMIMFTILMVSSVTISKNFSNTAVKNRLDSQAYTVLLKNVETCLATSYENLASYISQDLVEGTTFNVSVKVSRLSDQDFSKDDIVKIIDVKVSYLYNQNVIEKNMKTVKGKVL
ncbi:MAG: prepilin peptidase [Clostridia bacterium]|nr:prepilin peptidase [Clostridia bacterium]